MSSPQLEDGHVRIANELFDAVLRFPFSKRQQTIIWAVMRKTYGYRKKRDDISLSQLSQITGLDASNISKAINELAQMKVLSKQPGRYGQVLEVQKDFQSWRSGQNDQPWSKQPSCSGCFNQYKKTILKRQYSTPICKTCRSSKNNKLCSFRRILVGVSKKNWPEALADKMDCAGLGQHCH